MVCLFIVCNINCLHKAIFSNLMGRSYTNSKSNFESSYFGGDICASRSIYSPPFTSVFQTLISLGSSFSRELKFNIVSSKTSYFVSKSKLMQYVTKFWPSSWIYQHASQMKIKVKKLWQALAATSLSSKSFNTVAVHGFVINLSQFVITAPFKNQSAPHFYLLEMVIERVVYEENNFWGGNLRLNFIALDDRT